MLLHVGVIDLGFLEQVDADLDPVADLLGRDLGAQQGIHRPLERVGGDPIGAVGCAAGIGSLARDRRAQLPLHHLEAPVSVPDLADELLQRGAADGGAPDLGRPLAGSPGLPDRLERRFPFRASHIGGGRVLGPVPALVQIAQDKRAADPGQDELKQQLRRLQPERVAGIVKSGREHHGEHTDSEQQRPTNRQSPKSRIVLRLHGGHPLATPPRRRQNNMNGRPG